jgi:hypothetical protein
MKKRTSVISKAYQTEEDLCLSYDERQEAEDLYDTYGHDDPCVGRVFAKFNKHDRLVRKIEGLNYDERVELHQKIIRNSPDKTESL